jgi:hypothetical protein
MEQINRGESINRYHLCSNWLFDYWKSRAHLTACVASAWRNRIYALGREVPVDVIRRNREGRISWSTEMDRHYPRLVYIGAQKIWRPDRRPFIDPYAAAHPSECR